MVLRQPARRPASWKTAAGIPKAPGDISVPFRMIEFPHDRACRIARMPSTYGASLCDVSEIAITRG